MHLNPHWASWLPDRQRLLGTLLPWTWHPAWWSDAFGQGALDYNFDDGGDDDLNYDLEHGIQPDGQMPSDKVLFMHDDEIVVDEIVDDDDDSLPDVP